MAVSKQAAGSQQQLAASRLPVLVLHHSQLQRQQTPQLHCHPHLLDQQQRLLQQRLHHAPLLPLLGPAAQQRVLPQGHIDQGPLQVDLLAKLAQALQRSMEELGRGRCEAAGQDGAASSMGTAAGV